MLGQRYQITWLGRDLDGEPDVSNDISVTAVWVPDVDILFQWAGSKGVMQVSIPKVFPPSAQDARVRLLGPERVPNSVITAAKKYLAQIERTHAQEAVLQMASDLVESHSIRNQAKFQSAADRLRGERAS